MTWSGPSGLRTTIGRSSQLPCSFSNFPMKSTIWAMPSRPATTAMVTTAVAILFFIFFPFQMCASVSRNIYRQAFQADSATKRHKLSEKKPVPNIDGRKRSLEYKGFRVPRIGAFESSAREVQEKSRCRRGHYTYVSASRVDICMARRAGMRLASHPNTRVVARVITNPSPLNT